MVYDKPTNRATLERSHRCDDFLTFPGVEKALCVWKDYSVLRVYPTGYDSPSPERLIEIGDVISVKDGILRAKCPILASPAECVKWISSSGLQCVVSHTTISIIPEGVRFRTVSLCPLAVVYFLI